MTNKDDALRLSMGKKYSFMGIIINLLLFGLKLTASILSGSLAAITDAFNNLTDAASSIVSLAGFRLSERAADKEHPYGHARYEYLSALAVSFIILIIAFEFLKTSVKAILSPSSVELSLPVFIIMALTVVVKTAMSFFYFHTGKKISSPTFIATAQDARNDAFMTGCVIVGFAIDYFADVSLDGFISFAVACFIFVSGVSLIKNTIDPLIGQAPDKGLVEHIKNKILSYPNILGTHDLIVHDYGVGRRFASVHVEMAADLDVMESHDIIDRMEEDFRLNDNINMIVHMDPIQMDIPLRDTINSIAAKIHPDCSIHDLRIKENLIEFDCYKPSDCTVSDEALVAAFDVSLRLLNPSYEVNVTIDSGFSPVIH